MGLAAVIVGGLRWRVDIRGLDNVRACDGAVLAYNHHSYFDFVMAGWGIVRGLGRPIRYLAKREVWDSPWTRWAVEWGEAVPVDRADATSRHGAYDAAVGALADGDLVAVAPERTISRSFELLPFSTGAARMAQQAGVPIIPAVGWGTQRFATKGRGVHLAWRIPVTVVYDRPFAVAADEDPHAASDRLRARMAVVLDEIQRDYPDRPGPGDGWWQPARLGGTAPDHADVLELHRRRASRWDDRHESNREPPASGAAS